MVRSYCYFSCHLKCQQLCFPIGIFKQHTKLPSVIHQMKWIHSVSINLPKYSIQPSVFFIWKFFPSVTSAATCPSSCPNSFDHPPVFYSPTCVLTQTYSPSPDFNPQPNSWHHSWNNHNTSASPSSSSSSCPHYNCGEDHNTYHQREQK